MIMLIALCVVFVISTTGCSSKSSDSSPTNSASKGTTAPKDAATPATVKKLDPVELIWYYPQPKAQTDLQLVNDEVNKIIKEKINATIKLQPVDFGTYEAKLNTIVAANEAIDIIWTSNWLFNWVNNQKKGVFQPLDDLLKNHGSKLYKSMPEKFWNDGKMDGKMYGVPNFQISAKRPGFVIQKRFVDKYKLDLSSIKKVEDIEPFLKQIKDGEPGIIPFGLVKSFNDGLLYGIDPIVPIYQNDPKHKIINGTTPEAKRYLTMVRSWYTKGYINKDAATLKNGADAYNKGTSAVWYDFTGKPGSEIEFKAQNGGFDVVLVPLSKPFFTGSASTMNAISRTSKNPERAMMFLELVNTDKQLYNVLTYGIAGKHYTKISDNFIKPIPDSGYAPNTDWVFGNITNGYLPEGAPADKFELTKKVNDEAIVSPYYGFVFNSEPVKTELANLKALDDEYSPGLNSGTVDPDQYLPIYDEKQKKAGLEKVTAEKQKQLDAWLQLNGKK